MISVNLKQSFVFVHYSDCHLADVNVAAPLRACYNFLEYLGTGSFGVFNCTKARDNKLLYMKMVLKPMSRDTSAHQFEHLR